MTLVRLNNFSLHISRIYMYVTYTNLSFNLNLSLMLQKMSSLTEQLVIAKLTWPLKIVSYICRVFSYHQV